MDQTKIKRRISDHLLWDDRLKEAEINVEYNNGVVNLSGYAPSHYARLAAENDVFQIRGVSEVHNHLSVKRHDAETPSDDEIKKQLKDLFYWNDRIDYSRVDVLVQGRSAMLIGTVDAFWKIEMAENLAYTVRGVMNVVNKLSASPTKNMTDESLARNITDAIDRNSDTDPDYVSVGVSDGMVILEGQVNSWRQKEAIYRCAAYARGVRQVINNIRVFTK